jgi:hypothetical protein
MGRDHRSHHSSCSHSSRISRGRDPLPNHGITHHAPLSNHGITHHAPLPNHGITYHACYDPPLPPPNAQMNQWEEQELSYTNNASHFNANDENDAVGALL